MIKEGKMDKKRILIVDDEPDIVETIRYNLELEGYQCLVAYDGYTAIETVHREHPNLIILDIRLPKKNGYQVSRLLKFDKNYKDIPILMLTARTREEDKLIGMNTGADEYLTKPFEMSDLLGHVRNKLESR